MILLRRISSIIIGIALFVLTVLYLGPVSERVIERFYLKPEAMEYIAASQAQTIFQGTVLQGTALRANNTLMLYGSSEFSAWSEFHPSSFFGGKPTGFVPVIIGRGGTQNLVHAFNAAAQGENIRGKKVAVILSAQWFTPEGIPPGYMGGNFSPLQTYRMLFNNSLSLETRRKLADRLLQFDNITKDFPTLSRTLREFDKPIVFNLEPENLDRLRHLVEARLEMSSFELKDAVKSVSFLKDINAKVAKLPKDLPPRKLPPWPELKEKAAQQGKAASKETNNRFGIMDSYYNQHVKPALANSQGTARYAKLYPSPEYYDLELLMQVFKEQGTKALFIIVPVNGAWYDYTGFPINERKGYYQRVSKMIKDNGFKVADFSDREYEKYFLQDVMHVGWKGWVNVNEALDQFVHQN